MIFMTDYGWIYAYWPNSSLLAVLRLVSVLYLQILERQKPYEANVMRIYR